MPFAKSASGTILNFEVRSHNCVDAQVLVNGEARTRWKFSDCNAYSSQSLTLKPEEVGQGMVTVSFEMPDVQSPQDIDPANADRRKLGLSVRRIVAGPLSSRRQTQPVSSELREGDAIRFDRRGNAEQYLATGWSSQEAEMRWTDGKLASLQLPLAEGMSGATLSFEAMSHNCIDVGVLVNDKPRKKWTFTDCARYVTQAVVLGREDMSRGTVTVTFAMPDAKSPQELDPASTDRRQLGISVKKIVVGKEPARD